MRRIGLTDAVLSTELLSTVLRKSLFTSLQELLINYVIVDRNTDLQKLQI